MHCRLCIVCGTSSDEQKLFYFSSNAERYAQWLKSMGMKSCTRNSMICARHFTPDSFTNSFKIRLNKTAIPTLYPCFPPPQAPVAPLLEAPTSSETTTIRLTETQTAKVDSSQKQTIHSSNPTTIDTQTQKTIETKQMLSLQTRNVESTDDDTITQPTQESNLLKEKALNKQNSKEDFVKKSSQSPKRPFPINIIKVVSKPKTLAPGRYFIEPDCDVMLLSKTELIITKSNENGS